MLDKPNDDRAPARQTGGAPRDFQEHLADLEARGLLIRIDHPVNKDTELHPLVRLQFLGVIGDSRCPMNAICIQAGDAIVQIGVTGHGAPQDYQLHSDPRFAAVTRGDLRIELIQLQPLPLSGTTLEQERYRATFKVTQP